tara:strand:+ start:268 stop:399 length:132 start_codon:yes stop_codon:yes gene_type:complete
MCHEKYDRTQKRDKGGEELHSIAVDFRLEVCYDTFVQQIGKRK